MNYLTDGYAFDTENEEFIYITEADPVTSLPTKHKRYDIFYHFLKKLLIKLF